MKLTIIICTKDRPKEIREILESIVRQTLKPQKIIIIDGSDNPVKEVVEKFQDLNIQYQTCRPPSLPRQRNQGISQLTDEDTWVGFLDDDLVLFEDAFEEIARCIEKYSHEKLGGVGLTIQNVSEIKRSFVRELFYLDEPQGGRFTPSGCPSTFRKRESDQEVEWLSGGVSFWNHQVLKEYRFDEWFSGTGYLEDVDFSYHVSRDYKLIMCGQAKCYHYDHPVRKEKMVKLGVWQLSSWWYFKNKAKNFKTMTVLWSMFGVFLNNVIMGVLKPRSFRLRKSWGNLIGFVLIFTGRAHKVEGFSK